MICPSFCPKCGEPDISLVSHMMYPKSLTETKEIVNISIIRCNNEHCQDSLITVRDGI